MALIPYSIDELDRSIADEFEPEFDSLANEVQEEILAQAKLLERFGPVLGRPHVDTLRALTTPI